VSFCGQRADKVRGVILLGTIAVPDVSMLDLRVWSFNGTRDGIFAIDYIET